MLGAEFAQALQVAFWRNEHAGGAGDGFDDHGGDGRGVVQVDEAFERVGVFGAVFGLAAREGVAGDVMRVGQVIDAADHRAEIHPVARDAADGHAAEIDAVIGALAADEAVLVRLAARLLVGERDLERGLDALRSGVGEEDAVEAVGREAGEAVGEFEGERMAHVEVAGVVEFARGLADRLDDLRLVVAGGDAPEAGGAVEDRAAFGRVVVHLVGAHDHARIGLERLVRRERHPESVERVGAGCVCHDPILNSLVLDAVAQGRSGLGDRSARSHTRAR